MSLVLNLPCVLLIVEFIVTHQISCLFFSVFMTGQGDDNNAQSNNNQEYAVHVELQFVEYSGSRELYQ